MSEGETMGNLASVPSQTVRLWALAGCLVTVAGCSWFDSQSAEPLTPVAIESLHDVDGRWEGIVSTLQGRDKAWVTVTITNRDTFATYTFVGTGKEIPFMGTGRLLLQSGRLLTEGEGRTLTFTLAEREGVRMLVVDGLGKDGKSHHAELSRAE